jgi:hypothetical protein
MCIVYQGFIYGRRFKAACAGCQLPKYKLLGHSLVTLCCCVSSVTIQAEVNRLFPVANERVRGPPSPPPSASTVITFNDIPDPEERYCTLHLNYRKFHHKNSCGRPNTVKSDNYNRQD